MNLYFKLYFSLLIFLNLFPSGCEQLAVRRQGREPRDNAAATGGGSRQGGEQRQPLHLRVHRQEQHGWLPPLDLAQGPQVVRQVQIATLACYFSN